MTLDSLWEAAEACKPDSINMDGRELHPTAYASMVTVGAKVLAQIEWRFDIDHFFSMSADQVTWKVHEGANLPWTVKHQP